MTTEQQARTITITSPGTNDIHFERIFDAPRDLVWRTFTDPALLSEWWGGGGISEQMDLRVGGSWRFLGGQKEDGSKFVFSGEYLEIDPPKRLVQTVHNSWSGQDYTEAIDFEDMGDGRTRFSQTTTFKKAEDRDATMAYAVQGFNFIYSSLDRLLKRLSDSNA
jgi:uncharacterized protein YndB with AHSA1/START domain